jgi:hypothetical protein
VAIVTVFPDDGTEPANVTTPSSGAATRDPGSPATSIPRCCPLEYGCAGSNANGCRTAPAVGHVHALADGARRRTASVAASRSRRIGTTLSFAWNGVRSP